MTITPRSKIPPRMKNISPRSSPDDEDLSKVEEDLSEDDEEEDLPKFEEEPFDFGYISEPEDYSMFESPICRGQTRLFWNLEQYPISESANLVSIHRNIKLALHRVGVHGFLEILAYGGVKPNRDERDLYEACIHYMPPYKGGQLSIAGQISLDIVRFAQGLYPLRTAFVVISKHIPEIEETKRVLRCLQTRYQHPVLIVDPTAHDDGSFFPFESADSVYARTQFVDGGQSRPRIPRSQRWREVEEAATGVFWDAKDCPFPAGWSADTIYTKIRSAFTEAYCVSGNMSISSYADEMNNESWNKPPESESESRINHLILAGDKPARLERMFNDMLLWLIHKFLMIN
ncbi:unnamed protein product [Arabis nemorensis]|uniref:NYN domain-containing protein n=1 Tax=Arabis nemorensis TaxID=586526 RepID=A0A565BF19_9BRAS|nr:unnamed protein product [Arabis nemorensis]